MEHISLSDCPEFLKPNVNIGDVKTIIKEKTGITEENKRIQISFNYYGQSNNNNSFWSQFKIDVYDISKYLAKLRRLVYETDVILDLNKKIEELKQMVFEQTKIRGDRLKFYKNNNELEEDWCFTNTLESNLFESEIKIEITKKINDIIYIKYPNSEIKEIRTDLYNTGFELLEELGNNAIEMNSGFSVKYNLFFKDKKLELNKLLKNSIEKEDLIKLVERNNVQILFNNLNETTTTFEAEFSDEVGLFKYFVQLKEGIPFSEQRLLFSGKQLEDNRTLADYNIKKHSTIYLILRLRGG